MHAEYQAPAKTEMPTGAAIFPKDLITAPKEFGSRVFNIQHWSEIPRAGHFAEMEQPDLLANDIRKLAAKLMNV